MRIGELARAAGTTPRAIRYYEQQGLLAADRAANGYRTYSPVAVAQVRNIRRLLSLGFTTDEVHTFLPCLDRDLDGGVFCEASTDALLNKIALLDGEISALTAMREKLTAALHGVTDKAAAS
ncbi:MerR family transcriptional regulator [Pseudonocardia acaciae]|uniref:MerR family transcriptional regulator n=1 Tax=Pseudonocardia acaciae TaxID=551276 RepID=UPI00048A7FAC|nr:MerR family transcriptional regulator [Pseudonocardia acaciae]